MVLKAVPDFKVGDEVYECGDRYGEHYLISAEADSNGYVDITDMNGNPIRDDENRLYHKDDLMLFDAEAQAKAAAIVKEIAVAIDSFKEAFEALRAAEDAANKLDYSIPELRYEKLVDFSELENLIEENGWSSSSLYC